MLTGEVVMVDFGNPIGSEAGFRRPAVLITADAFLRFQPTTVFVVPLTSSPRSFPSHVEIVPAPENGLRTTSYAQVEQMRAVSRQRCSEAIGTAGAVAVHQILDILAMITGMP